MKNLFISHVNSFPRTALAAPPAEPPIPFR